MLRLPSHPDPRDRLRHARQAEDRAAGGLKTNADQAKWAVIPGIAGLVGAAIYDVLYFAGTINHNFSTS